MEQYFLQFLNVYFWVFLVIITLNLFVYWLDEDMRDLQIISNNKNPKLFTLIMWTLFFLSIKIT